MKVKEEERPDTSPPLAAAGAVRAAPPAVTNLAGIHVKPEQHRDLAAAIRGLSEIAQLAGLGPPTTPAAPAPVKHEPGGVPVKREALQGGRDPPGHAKRKLEFEDEESDDAVAAPPPAKMKIMRTPPPLCWVHGRGCQGTGPRRGERHGRRPTCPRHKVKCVVGRPSQTPDNQGRIPFACPGKDGPADCVFHSWADEPEEPPLCNCRVECTGFVVRREGSPNWGRPFWRCPFWKGESNCGYMEWRDLDPGFDRESRACLDMHV